MSPKAANAGKSLLLVDDDRLVLVTLAKGLSDQGYKIDTAESVEDAEAILSSGERPDLAIIDVNMPGKNGLYLAERMLSFDHIPFIFLSAYSDHSFVQRATEYGALGYLIKPIDSPQLVPTIETALARAKELRQLKNTERDLQIALDNERQISVATGITMMHYRLSRKDAFELLRKDARSQHRKLAELAKDVVAAAETLSFNPPIQKA
jgi:AmiR/NasT family two-component response regulator